MMRIMTGILFALLMTACSAKSYNPAAAVEIYASEEDQQLIIEATKAFGERNGFKVYASNDLPRGDRRVSQVDLHREDGVMLVMDNFMKAEVLSSSFYAKEPSADWLSVKDAWLREVRATLGADADIHEVPVGHPDDPLEHEQ